VLNDARLSRIDGEWRKVVLPLDKFAKDRPLDLKRVWGIDFSDSTGRPLAFRVNRIGFSDDCPPLPKFKPSAGYDATATVEISKTSGRPDTSRSRCSGSCPRTRIRTGSRSRSTGPSRRSRTGTRMSATG